ncbi:hypothetical protein A0H81_07318 [Grifola frondosa]|uniref:Uncharacterized protein n=1 Tax=Grifola frondosa TaxID=5627 RepID=A0A1C7M771_GRIFR|nr:hypothetical protein A0H81_07318 [Grifola frondosa]
MSFSCLEETVCRYQLPDDFTSIRLGNLWRAAGPSLHNVTVSIFSRTPMTVLSQQVVEERFSLVHNTSLRTIRFDGSSPSGMPLECGWMYFMLAQVVSPHVESVIFAFRTIHHASFLMRDYTHLIDSTLTRPPFAELQTVLFLLDTPFSDDDARLLRDQFPELCSRRLLRIRGTRLLHSTLNPANGALSSTSHV